MSEWVTVNIGGKIVRRKVPANATDQQVRSLMAPVMRQYGVDTRQQAVLDQRTKPQSNEAYWQERLKGQGNLKAGDDTIRSRISRGASGLARKIVGDERHAARIGEKVAGAADWVPGLGDAMGLQEAASDVSRGLKTNDYATAGFGAVLGALTLLPGGADKPIKRKIGDLFRDENGAIRAWHGSPHDFDRFSLDKIGTGEGAQAYGHGLYFAENPTVATEYRDKLSGSQFRRLDLGGQVFNERDLGGRSSLSDPQQVAAEALFRFNGDKAQALAFLRNDPSRVEKDAAAWLGKTKAAPVLDRDPTSPGRLYEVNIDAEPEDFLDWDAPLSRQNERVQDVLGYRDSLSKVKDTEARMADLRAAVQGRKPTAEEKAQMSALGRQRYGLLDGDGRTAYGYLDGAPLPVGSPYVGLGAMKAPRMLLDKGVPGIKYLDQGSRGATQGTSNFVVFDDKLVNILNKY